MNRPAILIPDFNHKEVIGSLLDRLAVYNLPCLIVNDGSEPETRRVLEQQESERDWVRVLHLPLRRGKGGAVLAGLFWLNEAGYTHALQLDADGQHDTADVPKFLKAAETDPDALILGRPIYSADAPKSRIIGRQISRVWVWIETLSFDIADPMLGFRVYPLQATTALARKHRLGTKMDFDPEIAVRLCWRGVPIRNVDTRIAYPSGGLSHFQMIRDNVLISWLHTRLFFGMCIRLPKLLMRKKDRITPSAWSKLPERGSIYGMRIVLLTMNVLGYGPAFAMTVPVVAYLFITGKRSRRASGDYLAKLHRFDPKTPRPTLWQSYLHHLEFGRNILDRLLLWQGKLKRFHFEASGRELMERNGRSGSVLLGAHLGSFDALRSLALGLNSRIHVVMFRSHAKQINRILKELSANTNLRVVELVPGDLNGVLDLKACIDRGEHIALMADRHAPGAKERICRVPFLGEIASFPQSPWILASLLDCPVLMVMALRTGHMAYRVMVEPLADRIVLPRKGRDQHVHPYIEKFVRRLEELCCAYPLQWFNFYEFWNRDE